MKKLFHIIALLSVSLVFCQNDASLAENYFRQGEYKKASQMFRSLQKENPFNTRYLKRLIACLQETDEYPEAEKILKQKLLENPTQKYLHVEIGFNYDRQQKNKLAKEEYSLAIEAIKSNPGIGGVVGGMFQENNLLDLAIEAYSMTMALNKNLNYEFQIARIYGEKGDVEKMFDSYIKLIDKNENNIENVQRWISGYINDDGSSKNNVALKKSLLKTSASNPKNVWNELLSWLFTKQKEYGKAFIQEKALFIRDPKFINTISRLAKIAYEDRDYRVAKKCFTFLLENTNFIEEKLIAELYLLKIAIKTADIDCVHLFEKTLEKYGVNSNSIEIQILFSDYLIFQKNNPPKAIDVLEDALSFSKNKFLSAQIKLKLGEAHVFLGSFNKALLYFSQVQTKLKNHPLSQQARFKVAQTSYFKGDFKWAKSQLKILKGSTTQLIANDAVDLFLIISDNESKDSISSSGLTNFAKADLLAYQNRTDEAISIYSLLLKKYQGQPIEDEVLFNQANLFITKKQYEKAISNLLKIISIDAYGILVDDSYYLLAETYKNNIKNFEKATEYYQKIIFEKPSSIYLVDARRKYREIRGDAIN
tara:strand:+ start:8134 stop:9909 length:1776 start_codon:yes stop_codon:yes gene_type:complete